VPAGAAWLRLRAARLAELGATSADDGTRQSILVDETLALYASDEEHPGVEGATINLYALYAVLTGQTASPCANQDECPGTPQCVFGQEGAPSNALLGAAGICVDPAGGRMSADAVELRCSATTIADGTCLDRQELDQCVADDTNTLIDFDLCDADAAADGAPDNGVHFGPPSLNGQVAFVSDDESVAFQRAVAAVIDDVDDLVNPRAVVPPAQTPAAKVNEIDAITPGDVDCYRFEVTAAEAAAGTNNQAAVRFVVEPSPRRVSGGTAGELDRCDGSANNAQALAALVPPSSVVDTAVEVFLPGGGFLGRNEDASPPTNVCSEFQLSLGAGAYVVCARSQAPGVNLGNVAVKATVETASVGGGS
jgi:hypothetical protein